MKGEFVLKNLDCTGYTFEELLNIFPELFSSDPKLHNVPNALMHYKERLTNNILQNDIFRNKLIAELSNFISAKGNFVTEKELKLKKQLFELAQSEKKFTSFIRNISILQERYSMQITDTAFLNTMRSLFNELYDQLVDLGLCFNLLGRRKALISFEEKLLRNALNNKTPNSLKDIFAFRIVLFDDNINYCYQVMEVAINFFETRGCLLDDPTPLKDTISQSDGNKPCMEKIKDYIQNPKTSGYQSLHALFVNFDGRYFELQVRNQSMNLIAEKGTAAHDGVYKSKDTYSILIPKINMCGFVSGKKEDGSYIYEDGSGILDSINILTRQRTF